MSKRLSKYIASSDYFEKSLTIGEPVRIASAIYSLTLSISIEIEKNLLKTKNEKKRHNKVVMLA